MRASSFTIVIVALALFSVHEVTESKFLLVEIQKGSAYVHEKGHFDMFANATYIGLFLYYTR